MSTSNLYQLWPLSFEKIVAMYQSLNTRQQIVSCRVVHAFAQCVCLLRCRINSAGRTNHVIFHPWSTLNNCTRFPSKFCQAKCSAGSAESYCIFCQLGSEVNKQGFRTTWLTRGRKFQGKSLHHFWAKPQEQSTKMHQEQYRHPFCSILLNVLKFPEYAKHLECHEFPKLPKLQVNNQ